MNHNLTVKYTWQYSHQYYFFSMNIHNKKIKNIKKNKLHTT